MVLLLSTATTYTSNSPIKAEEKPLQRNNRFDRSNYKPAILRLSLNTSPNSQNIELDTILIPPTGDPKGVRTIVNKKRFNALIELLYQQTSEAQSLNVEQQDSASRQLYDILIANIEKELQEGNITTLLISLDPELQRIPFAALHNGKQWLGMRYAFSITPSVSLMPRGAYQYPSKRNYLLAGSSNFKEMSSLPYVTQEIEQLKMITNGETLINDKFTKKSLITKGNSRDMQRIHLATHGEFIPGEPINSKLYLTDGSISMQELRELGLSSKDSPLELLTLSACRTALGDNRNELGLSGLALMAGAQSAIGNLWYVDDIASSIFFIRFYYWLEKGLPKAEALQQAQREFVTNQYQLQGKDLLSPEGTVMIKNLSIGHRIQIKEGLSNPYFWAAPVLIGKPW
ncbi:CHAT domain-containing protein [Synechococcus sp. MIT S1220]|uniref:CHAT domain-containing protein n=1 Tax=Synechococcus sp. MIT S1220 TaxID=3082549 RepID=UPI0039AF52E4